MKNTITLAIVRLFIIGFIITSTIGLSQSIASSVAVTPKGSGNNYANVVQINASPQYLLIETETIKTPYAVPKTFGFPEQSGNQFHPAFGRTDTGIHMAGYRDENLANIIWTYSANDESPYYDGVYFDTSGDYPSIKLWGGQRFFGTYVTDPNDHNGGAFYTLECTDPLYFDTYILYCRDQSTKGWYNMIDADIACDNSQNYWEWGVSSYVISSTWNGGYINGPTIMFADPNNNGSAFLTWYSFNGCAHTDVDIDPVTHMSYAVYDWYNPALSKWELLVRVLNFTNPGAGSNIFNIQGTGNLRYPAVAVYNNSLIIVAETDENGNKDIICYHSNSGMTNLLFSFVADLDVDEKYPDIRYATANTFFCTFVKGNNLYASKTEDAGTNWNTPVQINGNSGLVITEYKTADICEKALMAMWEEQHNDSDIYIGNVWQNNIPPNKPYITGLTTINLGVSYNYTFSTTDPDGDDVSYYVDWGDGTNTGWLSQYASDEQASATHSWSGKGTYVIKVKAKDIHDAESDWATLTVTVTKSSQISQSQNLLLSFLKFALVNKISLFTVIQQNTQTTTHVSQELKSSDASQVVESNSNAVSNDVSTTTEVTITQTTSYIKSTDTSSNTEELSISSDNEQSSINQNIENSKLTITKN